MSEGLSLVVQAVILWPFVWVFWRANRGAEALVAEIAKRGSPVERVAFEDGYRLGYRNATHDAALGSPPNDDPGDAYEVSRE